MDMGERNHRRDFSKLLRHRCFVGQKIKGVMAEGEVGPDLDRPWVIGVETD